jgi:hypothetical protein
MASNLFQACLLDGLATVVAASFPDGSTLLPPA